MEILLKPVATVRNSRKTPTDDFWGEIISERELCDHIPDEALEGISDFLQEVIKRRRQRSKMGRCIIVLI